MHLQYNEWKLEMHMSVPMGSFTDFKPLSFFQNRLIKRKKFAVQKLGEHFLVLIKISHLVFISKAFFSDMGIFPKKHLKRRI